jgi:hypothetical protein
MNCTPLAPETMSFCTSATSEESRIYMNLGAMTGESNPETNQ